MPSRPFSSLPRTPRFLLRASFCISFVSLVQGCASTTGYQPAASGVTATDASYLREQAKQIFGTDLIRVEPLREATLTPDEYSKARRQLDLRAIASSAPKPGPVLARRQLTARDWDSDRPAPTTTRTIPNTPAAPLLGGSQPLPPSAGPNPLLTPDSPTRARSTTPDARGTGSPWDLETGRERRALARAGLLDTAAAPADRTGPLIGEPADSSLASPVRSPAANRIEIDPAFQDLVASSDSLFGGQPTWANADHQPSSPSTDADPVVPPTDSPSPGGWTIILALFKGDGAAAAARQTLTQVQTEGRLPEAYIQERGPAYVICHGSFASEDDPATQTELRRLKSLQIAGGTPYASVYLAPPLDAGNRVKGEFDLRTAKRVFGNDALYTLQVGFYGREDVRHLSAEEKSTIQAAAEQAAADLRRQGELAFYYHGTHRSMVTVGVFGPDDFNPLSPTNESRRLSDVRRRHPLNLYNGAGYTGKTPGMREAKLVPSALVAVPEK